MPNVKDFVNKRVFVLLNNDIKAEGVLKINSVDSHQEPWYYIDLATPGPVLFFRALNVINIYELQG